MIKDGKIYFAKTGEDLSQQMFLLPKMANRHGFICGATGTGKTITLKVLAESFSDLGVPVFLADVKGDLSGMIFPGTETDDMKERIARCVLGKVVDLSCQKYSSNVIEKILLYAPESVRSEVVMELAECPNLRNILHHDVGDTVETL